MNQAARLGRGILVAVGLLFLVTGVVVLALATSGVIPKDYRWVGPLFLALGLVGAPTAYLGLRSPRWWPIIVLASAYLPWTVVGLLGDIRMGYWALVAGEGVGLVLVTVSLIAAASWTRKCRRRGPVTGETNYGGHEA
jgi:4-amino-4-deoxy-L-arabinose transferase-like glycosyltransferase